MGREEQIITERLKKIAELRKNGINPYPYSYDRTHQAGEVLKEFDSLKNEESSKKKVRIAGRVMVVRDMGRIAFCQLQDSSGKIQAVLQEGETTEEEMELFKKYVDSGDFIGVEGVPLRTKRGELSVLAKKIEILTKALLPLPEKFSGLQDKEERYRKRYLDLMINPEVKKVFEKREVIIDAIREFLKKRGFNEVDIPYLQTVYGGASARPFVTHLNALNIPLFLSISPELHLKRLIVGGFDKVFSIARNFRNEGIDRSHNPEFSMMEIYQAYADYNDMMSLTEELFEYVAKKANGSTKVKIGSQEVDFKRPWARMTMLEAVKKYAKIDANKMSEKELQKFMEENNIEEKGKSWGLRVQALFEHFCEKELIQPTFITDHPLETTPLCKTHRNGDKRLIERFEPFCMGMELANAYSELNDPVTQRELLELQQKELSEGNNEAHPYDEDFVNAIEVGLPPTGGLGIGIDRMIILMTEQESIRDVILFPLMKPEVGEKLSKKEAEEKYRSKKVVVIADDKQEAGVVANAIGQLGISIGGHSKQKLFEAEVLHDKEGRTHYTDCFYPMTNLAGTQKDMAEFVQKCYDKNIQVFDFTDVMRKAHSDEEMQKGYKAKGTKELGYIAVGALVPKDFEKDFLSKLKLFGNK
jgi:lysyl-tRNA synthetase, class II